MNKLIESLKYVTLLSQIEGNKLGYIRAVILYRFTKHPRKMTFPEMIVKLHGAKFITRKNTYDSAILSTLYEKELTEYMLKKKPGLFVDVGAHIGRFSILLAKNGSDVIAIEPSLSNYKQLNINILLNKLNNIRTLDIGCSDKEGIGNLGGTAGYTGQNTFLEGNHQNVEKVKLNKLENLIDRNMTHKDIIKMDVEGFEMKVLKGMKNILKTQNPIIVTEISSEKDKKEISIFLKEFKYHNTKILDGRNFVFEKRIF